MKFLHCRARNAEGVGEGPELCLRINCLVRLNFSNTTLVLLELLVAESVLSHSKTGTKRLFATEALLDLVTKCVGRKLGRWEAGCFTESKLLLGRRAVTD